ncbi:coiled-coil domain-containing protein 6-like isoform X2 [Saccostrea echinata]|uniref:coiled-coil domain-containing protein 6-like isoform X2 n=1 Tax=Saccostrea echinata TaxID=191078 RepID=UPI002A7EF4E6|nr:coiled-coil domain-containing protein 6-like isoform X2 [Saccostrea echinata]
MSARRCSGVMMRRKSSEGLLDTADDLAEKLDCLGDILEEIDHKYNEAVEVECAQEAESGTNVRLYRRLKDGLESARTLIGCLRREKWRLNRRRMSVELRLDEMEDYKTHIKKDMSSLNDTVDVLSLRIVQLENDLVEQQEVQEELEAERADLQNQVIRLELKCKDLEEDKNIFQDEIRSIKRQRSNASLQLENDELLSDIEVLREENKNLKEMIRALEDANNPKNQDGGSDVHGYKNLQNIENNNNKIPLKVFGSFLINEQSESTNL